MANFPEFHELKSSHIADAALFANRIDALSCWPQEGRIAEVGVAFGALTSRVFQHLNPLLYDAYDLFQLHKIDVLWGRPSKEIFSGKTQKRYYEDRFSNEISTDRLRLFEGDSSTELSKRDPSFYDVIYIDGDHTYDGVVRDTNASLKVIKPNGILVFNDYILYDKTGNKYGVIPVVNDLCNNHGWRVRYLALQKELFCDIALTRI